MNTKYTIKNFRIFDEDGEWFNNICDHLKLKLSLGGINYTITTLLNSGNM